MLARKPIVARPNHARPTRRWSVWPFLLIAGLIGITPQIALAHAGQHMSLSISITDEAIYYDILFSSDFHGFLIPQDRYKLDLELNEDGDAYVFLIPEQEPEQRHLIEKLWEGKNPVTVDGILVKPILQKFQFIPSQGDAGLPKPIIPPDLHFILEYPVKGRPKQVSMVWEFYPKDRMAAAYGMPPWIDIVAELDAFDENKMIVFKRDEPEIIWHAPDRPLKERIMPVIAEAKPPTFKVPAFSTALILGWGALLLGMRFSSQWKQRRKPYLALTLVPVLAALLGHNLFAVEVTAPWKPTVKLPEPKEAIAVFESLHRNVYRAFDYKSESDIYDALAQSVDGELLDQVYNEVYRSLIMREHGGAVARVQSVDILEATVESAGLVENSDEIAFQINTRWQVHGVVYHWGHVHARTNEYQAIYTVAQRGETWKITGAKVLQQYRVMEDSVEVPKESDVPASTQEDRP